MIVDGILEVQELTHWPSFHCKKVYFQLSWAVPSPQDTAGLSCSWARERGEGDAAEIPVSNQRKSESG